MAQRTIVQLTDDLVGKPIPDGKGETVRFSLDRTDYEIDLAEKNARALRDTFAKYVGAARRASGTRGASGGRGRNRATGSGARDYDPKAVRARAESQGIEVSSRGRVSPTSSPGSRKPTANREGLQIVVPRVRGRYRGP